MKWNDTVRRLAAVEALLESWGDSAVPDDMERDLVLDLLRQAYADIKFAKPDVEPGQVFEPEPVHTAEPEPEPEPFCAPEPVYEPEPESTSEPPRVELVVDQFVAEGGHKKKDVRHKLMSLYDDHAAAGETIGSGGRVGSLRDSIEINDKFLMVRDLFDSDLETFDRTIDRLEEFADLDDAMVYIYENFAENFAWNPDGEAVRLLVDLLTRKLS